MKRYSVGDCEMLEHKKGSYVHVIDMLAWLDELTDNDNAYVMQEAIEKLQKELGNL